MGSLYRPERGIHNYVPDVNAFAPFDNNIVGELVRNEGVEAGFVRVKGEHDFPPDIQERACMCWTEMMQGWMARGLSLPPPSGPLPYSLAGLPDSSLNTRNVVKLSPHIAVDAHPPQQKLDNSPYASAPSASMVDKPAGPVRQVMLPRGFHGRFSDPTSVPQTNAVLTADDPHVWEASSNAPSLANTETFHL